jgi:hypothetical protein
LDDNGRKIEYPTQMNLDPNPLAVADEIAQTDPVKRSLSQDEITSWFGITEFRCTERIFFQFQEVIPGCSRET